MKTKIDGKKVIKKVKIEYILAVILTAIIVIIFLSGSFDFSIISNDNKTQNYQTELENKLENTIKNVKGAGKTSVIITTDGTSYEEVLKESVTTYENGVKTTTETIKLINGKPYVLKTHNPNIVGVIVVCEGANDINVKLAITEILTTTLCVDCENIRILKMK